MGTSSQFRTFQTPSNYEEAIKRHAQYVRWYSALKCFCIDDMGRPDPSCSVCNGKGTIYYPLTSKRVVEKRAVHDGNILTATYKILEINKLVRLNNDNVAYSSISDKNIYLPNSNYKNSILLVDYKADIQEDYEGSGTYIDNNLIKVNLPVISTLQGDFTGELTNITYLHNDTKDEDITVISFWDNLILTSSVIDIGDSISIICKYINPERFLITSIDPKESIREDTLLTEEMTLSATFYGLLPVGEGDLITLLTAVQKTSIVGNFTAGETTYSLPNFYVDSILRVQDANGVIDNVQIIQNNKIKFNGSTPTDKFSVSYLYHPTFVVMEDLPSLRYAENKIFPKRVTLKRYDLYNRQDDRPLGRVDY